MDDEAIFEQTCEPARLGEDCRAYPFEVCDAVTQICVHKPVFPAQPTEIISYVLLPILFAVASVGGIGGGTILIPLLIGMFGFRTKDSIAIASAIVFLSSFCALSS